MKTTIRDIAINPLAHGTQLIIRVPDDEVDIDIDASLQIEITPIRKRRSLDANAYYWQLVHKIVEHYGVSVAEYHNRTLAELGYPLRKENGDIPWHMMLDGDSWMNQLPSETHYCPTRYTATINGKRWRAFYELKPSHLMNTKEMSSLIDYIVQDAEALGIETATPQELQRLKELWKPKKEGKYESS